MEGKQGTFTQVLTFQVVYFYLTYFQFVLLYTSFMWHLATLQIQTIELIKHVCH